MQQTDITLSPLAFHPSLHQLVWGTESWEVSAVPGNESIIAAGQPWSQLFDPTMVWGPVSGAMAYLGIRINLFR